MDECALSVVAESGKVRGHLTTARRRDVDTQKVTKSTAHGGNVHGDGVG